MKEKPRIINLSDFKGEYKIQEPSWDLIRVIIKSESANPYQDIIRARSYIDLRGVGDPYNGIYYIENVSHSSGKGEYKTSFTLTKKRLV